jgi:hypothetical protein
MTEGHTSFDSLESMLSHEAMSTLEHRSVVRVEIDQWRPGFGAVSGCEFRKVRSHGQGGVRRYVVKRSAYASDMVRRLTDDQRGREQLIWQFGVLDPLPAEVDCPPVGSARDGDGWALLMRDVSAS